MRRAGLKHGCNHKWKEQDLRQTLRKRRNTFFKHVGVFRRTKFKLPPPQGSEPVLFDQRSERCGAASADAVDASRDTTDTCVCLTMNIAEQLWNAIPKRSKSCLNRIRPYLPKYRHFGYDPGDPTHQFWKESQSVWFDDIVVATDYIGPIKK